MASGMCEPDPGTVPAPAVARACLHCDLPQSLQDHVVCVLRWGMPFALLVASLFEGREGLPILQHCPACASR